MTTLLLAMLAAPNWHTRAAASRVVDGGYPLSAWVAVAAARHPDPEVRRRTEAVRTRLAGDLTFIIFWVLVHTDAAMPQWVGDLNYDECRRLEYLLRRRGLDINLTDRSWGVPTAEPVNGVQALRDRKRWQRWAP